MKQDEFIDFCILCGSDYLPTLNTIGPHREFHFHSISLPKTIIWWKWNQQQMCQTGWCWMLTVGHAQHQTQSRSRGNEEWVFIVSYNSFEAVNWWYIHSFPHFTNIGNQQSNAKNWVKIWISMIWDNDKFDSIPFQMLTNELSKIENEESVLPYLIEKKKKT